MTSEKEKEIVNVKLDTKNLPPQFFVKMIKHLVQSGKQFADQFIVQAPRGDAIIVRVKKNGAELSISSGGDDDPFIYIKGEKEAVEDFIINLTIEAATFVVLEFCSALEDLCEAYSYETLQQLIQSS